MVRENNPIKKYYKISPLSNYSECLAIDCGKKMKGHLTNLEKHLERFHSTLFDKYKEEKKALCISPSPKKLKSNQESTLDNIFEKLTIKVEITEKQIYEGLIEMVTLNGRPFTCVDDSGFRKILNPILKGMNKEICINTNIIRKKVMETAYKIREGIKNEIKGRLVSLKIDAVTRLDRNILGINCQFIDNGKIQIRTLAMKEILTQGSGENIKNIIKSVMAIYEITNDQIYTITSDNGRNMVKSIKLLDNENNISLCETNIFADFDDNISDEDYDINYNLINIPNIYCIRCAAHTLQLAIDDSMKELPSYPIITRARQINKKMRTPTITKLLKSLNLLKPILDCHRWHSLYDMLERLIILKDFCNEMEDQDFHMLPSDWAEIEEILMVLKPLKLATKILQKEQLTLSCFYGTWINCILDIEALDSPFAKIVIENMKAREEKLLKNDVLLAALYVDLRYQCLLSEEEIHIAKIHLLKIWGKLEVLKNGCNDSSDKIQLSLPDKTDKLEKLLRMKEQSKTNNMENVKSAGKSIGSVLTLFLDQNRIGRDENVLEFWEKNKREHPKIYQLAQVVLAVPPTQVSVERAFSSLKFILSNYRSQMTDQILEDVLIIWDYCVTVVKVNFFQIYDFMDFKHHLTYSILRNFITIESVLLDLLTEATSVEIAEEIIDSIPLKTLQDFNQEELCDNTDYYAIESYDSNQKLNYEKFIEENYQQEKYWVGIRNRILHTLSIAILLGTKSYYSPLAKLPRPAQPQQGRAQGATPCEYYDKDRLLVSLRSTYHSLLVHKEKWTCNPPTGITGNYRLYGPFTSHLPIYLLRDGIYLEIILDTIRLILHTHYSLASDLGDPQHFDSQPNAHKGYCESIKLHFKGILEVLKGVQIPVSNVENEDICHGFPTYLTNSSYPESSSTDDDTIQKDEIVHTIRDQNFVIAAASKLFHARFACETLGLLTLYVGSLHQLLKPLKLHANKKGKKKMPSLPNGPLANHCKEAHESPQQDLSQILENSDKINDAFESVQNLLIHLHQNVRVELTTVMDELSNSLSAHIAQQSTGDFKLASTGFIEEDMAGLGLDEKLPNPNPTDSLPYFGSIFTEENYASLDLPKDLFTKISSSYQKTFSELTKMLATGAQYVNSLKFI